MTSKKNAQPHKKAELSATGNGSYASSIKPMTPRQMRVAKALADTNDWISREAIDGIAGASNGPEIVRQLRSRWGYDAIEMQRVSVLDCDGLSVQAGRYRLSLAGRHRLAEKGVQ